LLLLVKLLAEPVHEKTVRELSRRNRVQHDEDEAGRRETGQEPCKQPEVAETFSDDDQPRDDPWQPHLLSKEPHRTVKPEPLIPSQQLLSSVGKHHHAERVAEHAA
jgi:hypothetical protein